MNKIEYRVIPVTRFFVSRYECEQNPEGNSAAGSSCKGEFDNERVAYEVAYALCRAEHESLGWPLDDERIKYPDSIEQDPSPEGQLMT